MGSTEEDRGRRERGEGPQGEVRAKVLHYHPSGKSHQALARVPTVSASSAARASGDADWFSSGQTPQLGRNGVDVLSPGKPGPPLSSWDPTAAPRPVLSTFSPIDPRQIAMPRLQDATWASHHQWIHQTREGGSGGLPRTPAPLHSDNPRSSIFAVVQRCSGQHEARPCSQELTVLGTEPSALNHTTAQALGPVGQGLEGRAPVFPEKWGRERKGTYLKRCSVWWETPGSWWPGRTLPSTEGRHQQSSERTVLAWAPALTASLLRSSRSRQPSDTPVPAPNHTELSDRLSSVRGPIGQNTEGQPPPRPGKDSAYGCPALGSGAHPHPIRDLPWLAALPGKALGC